MASLGNPRVPGVSTLRGQGLKVKGYSSRCFYATSQLYREQVRVTSHRSLHLTHTHYIEAWGLTFLSPIMTSHVDPISNILDRNPISI